MTGHGIRPMASLFQALFAFSLALLVWVSPAAAIRDNDSYDGNIYALYAGNGPWSHRPTACRTASKPVAPPSSCTTSTTAL